MNNKEMQCVIDEIKKKDNFIVSSHVKPEGDSVGSQIAMLYLLKKLGKQAVSVQQDKVPRNLRFLDGWENIKQEMPFDFKPKAAILLDCPIKERTGAVVRYLGDIFLINIDHHVSNTYFGSVNWVEAGMSSVGEMMYNLIKMCKVKLNETVIKALYTAIVTDTGMFNYDTTTGDTHRAAGELIELGVKPRVIHNEVYENKSYAQMKMLGKALLNLQLTEGDKLAYITLSREMLDEEGYESIATEEFINYPRSIKGVEVAVFFNESANGSVNVSFRSNGKVDVNKIASKLGGGGHKTASGCLIFDDLYKVREKVLAEVKKVIRKTGKRR